MIVDALNRRSTLLLFSAAMILPMSRSWAAATPIITVHKDPNCGCCSGWVKHLQKAGFATKVTHPHQLSDVKKRLGVPDELASCHTAEVEGYVIEGHVPAEAIKRLLAERPNATGLAVPGMPIGSPGMEGSGPKPYDVVLFGQERQRPFMRFLEDRPLG